MKRRLTKNFMFSLGGVVFLLLVWLVAYFAVGNSYVLPSFWEAFGVAGKLFTEGNFYLSLWNTLLRTLCAFLVSFLLGAGLALASCLIAPVRAFFAPFFSVVRSVPTLAVMLMILLWTSPSFAPVVVTVLVLLPTVYAEALASFEGVKEEYGGFLTAYAVTGAKKIFVVYLGGALPSLALEGGSALSLGLKITVSAEVLAATYLSLGGMMQESQIYLEIPRLFALTVVCVLIGFLLEGGCYFIRKAAKRREA